MPTSRRFDDDEVSLIIRRAAELQERQPDVEAHGMTLADLEAVAREAGLDPELVRRAAAELETRHPSSVTLSGGSRLLGATTTLRYERVIERELSADDYERIVDEIRRATKDVGTVSIVGRTLAWSSTGASPGKTVRSVHVTVASRGGRTAIRVEETAGALAGGLFGGIVGGVGGGGSGIAVGVGLAAMHSVPAALGIWATLITGSYALARTIFAGVMRRRAAQLESLADRLSEI